MRSKASVRISLPLKKCKHGTFIQIEIQCVTPRPEIRDENWQETNSYMEDAISDYDDIDNKSDVSGCTFARSVGSSSSNHLENTSHPGELGSRETSSSVSGSRNSFDSMEGSLGRESFSSRSSLSGAVSNIIGRQESIGSLNSAPYSPYLLYDSPRSNFLSNNSGIPVSGRHLQNQREDFGRMSRAIATSPLRHAGPSKNFPEAEEDSVGELRAEARMWEQNARKLMLDLESLRKEFADQSKHLANLDMELSASHTESNRLNQEIEHLKILLEESLEKQKATEDLKLKADNLDNVKKELDDEIEFQKESNYNLALQLKKAQESNLELVSILQEMEETIEKQKSEIENLSTVNSKIAGIGTKYNYGHEDNGEANSKKEVSMEEMQKASCDLDWVGSAVEHPITELHADYEPGDNQNLKLEIQQLQESQKNLRSSILYLGKILEDKNLELEAERDLKTRTLLDCETQWRHKLTAKEEEIVSLEAKLSRALSAQDSNVTEFENRGNLSLIKEIEALKEKVQELERDCNELTDENLELLFRLKESRKDLSTSGATFDCSSTECPANDSSIASESEVQKLKSQVCQHEHEMKEKEILIEGIASDHLQIQCIDIGSKCTDLELQLEALEDKTCCLDGELSKWRCKAEEQELEIASPRLQLECYQGGKTGSKEYSIDVCTKCGNSESQIAIGMYEILPALCQQLQLFFINLKKQPYTLHIPVNTDCNYAIDYLAIANSITQKEQVATFLDNLIQLNNLFETRITVSEGDLQCSEEEIRARITNASEVLNKLDGDNLEKNTLVFSSQEPKSLNEKLESRVADLSNELLAKDVGIGELKVDHLLKEEEIKALMHHQRDLENQISDLKKTKGEMEENMDVMQREGSTASKCLDELRNDMMVLSSCMDSHVSANKVLQRKILELESSKQELELHLSELEEENVYLSERVSGLEAQLRYLTDAKESSRLELQHSESHIINLQDVIRTLENEMEAQKIDMKEKLQDMHKQWLEAQEECEYMKKANPKLQATAESLIDECSSLQNLNGELRQQKIDLNKRCTILEKDLRESRNKFSDYSEKIDFLEAKFSSMLEEIASKEKTLNSELDALCHQNKEHTEKIILEESLLNQMYLAKAVEVENLRLEVTHLTGQISATHDEKERTPSEVVLKMHSLHAADKSRLEASLQEFQGKVKWSEKKLDTVQMEYETKVLGLTGELDASKQNQEVLMANHVKLLGLLENVRSNEEKLEGTINELESKLKSSEYERLQLAEEISNLKIQLQKIPLLQDKVLALKSSLNETTFDNDRLRTSLQMVSGDYEKLMVERNLFVQKFSSMQKATSELEDCRRNKIALEEKILRLEGDLTAREALCAQDAELKNEFGRIRRVNSQFQRKINFLEEEKEEWLKRAQALEEELKEKKEVKQDHIEYCSNQIPVYPGSNATSISVDEELKLPEKQEEDNVIQFSKDQLKPSIDTDQLQQSSKSQDKQGFVRHKRQADTKHCYNAGSSQEIAIDTCSRIQVLENELSEALEANDMYRTQLQSLMSEKKISSSDAPEKLKLEDKAINRKGNEEKTALLEAELREIRERYSHISLKYAEVEAQREELVMKLKVVNSGRRWFS
ncbi:uncharacterized protein LOC132311882 isoform X2 [Cornus florida]|nr:uncharacterized protein LOC132311882 isoform X2 [Cornus florida]